MQNISKKTNSSALILNKKRKGFTLIELIVVIAIIGILVLLAMPKFISYTKEAKLTQIKHDIKVAETIMDEYLSIESKLPNDLDALDMDTPLAEGRLFETRGVATAIIGNAADFRDVTNMNEVLSIKSKLDGQFVANENGNVYYIHTTAIDIGETLPELTVADDQLYREEGVPTLASVWGEDAKEVMAMVTALDGVGVSVPTQEDAWNLYQDLKVADPVLLSKMIAVQPQIWTGNYNEVTADLNSIKDGVNAWLTGLFSGLEIGLNTSGGNMVDGYSYTLGTTTTAWSSYTYKVFEVYVGVSTARQPIQNPCEIHWHRVDSIRYRDSNSILIDWTFNFTKSGNTQTASRTDILYPGTTYLTEYPTAQTSGISVDISTDAPVLDSGYNAETDRGYPEAPWLGAYSDTWQDVKMARSGNKDIYLGTIDRYINDIVNVLTWDNVDDISYYGGGSATTTTLTVTPDGLLEVTVPE